MRTTETALRARKSAAPLKRALGGLWDVLKAVTPRSKERGTVEAASVRRGDKWQFLTPRSKERGTVEAGLVRGFRFARQIPLRARKSAAPLKLTFFAMLWRAKVRTPRSKERGTVEASPACAG